MLPLFKEYISFLNEKTNNKLEFLEEGYYWYDRSIIKAYDIFGSLYKIARIYIDDNLNNIDIKIYNDQILMLESWSETVARNDRRLVEIERESLNLIERYSSKYSDRKLAILSSGGKDSSVVTHLVRKVNPDTEVIFNNTSLDCADTYLHIKKDKNLRIINPKEGFYPWLKKQNFIPTRFKRACCGVFKEQPMVDALDKEDKYLFFMGMRNQESNKRKDYLDEWKNDKWKDLEWDAILPVRKWSETDIWLYILKEGISINPKYRKGYSRVGCSICCPYYTKSTWVLDKYWYPNMRNRWENILREDFRKNNKDLIMNCTELEYLTCWNGSPLRDEPTKEVILQYADRNRMKIDVAKSYFGHVCSECGEKIKDKEVIGMNFKFMRTEPKDLLCKKHLQSLGNISDESWDYMCEMFRENGCVLV